MRKDFLNYAFNQINRFIGYHLGQVQKEGPIVLLRKLYALAWILLFIPCIFVIRILRPLRCVRFGCILCERIGHFATNTEVYICERDAKMHNPRNFDIFYYNSQMSNHQLDKMWRRLLRISHLAKFADKANHLLPGAKNHIISLQADRDTHGLFNRLGPHLFFTPKEELLGKRRLSELGISDGSSFVCFHSRDTRYLNIAMIRKRDWNYHNYRNSNIHNYMPAVEELTRSGYYAIRMGAVVETPLNINNSKIIDYAISGKRSDFLDIYLLSRSTFFIGDTSGLNAVPLIFRRPIVYINIVPLEYVFTGVANSLFIPKKLWLKDKHRFLTFKEILNSDIGRFVSTEDYEKQGIELIENTPEEITAVVMEMEKRLKGNWHTMDEDEHLQRRFWSFYKPNELNQIFQLRIGAEFLRQNKELLETAQSLKN